MKVWLNVTEAAEYAGVCRDTIYTACERRELDHARIGGRRAIRVKPAWIDRWLERHARAAVPTCAQAEGGSTYGTDRA
jgi:excisionase family DNA binding protein